ncbi:MAG: pyruvate:ferredoxin (flavodoxin) oxidoreductase [Ignavibacteria bacterium]|nr:pyruvate:ferredoxin (flavodoxin) oxidoreductase [Ignavibacteria bacterium]
MGKKMYAVMDGNEAAAYVAFRVNEVIAIYPITPSSNMGEWCDEWAAKGYKNIWGITPTVVEMQSEAGAAGTVHGALQAGALTTTFTAAQGLLLKIPNMFKIAGELTPTVFNISARALATHALSIFGDHSDVMAARMTGFGMMASSSVQEVMDLELIAYASSLESRIPMIQFFDGFRTSHEENKIVVVPDDVMREMMPDELIKAHRLRALNPERPVIRGTAQNPDVFFQNRETVNRFYAACPEIVQKTMDKFATFTGRQYHLFDYFGHPEAERVIVIMASGGETAEETVKYLVKNYDERVGVIRVRLYRPFSIKHFIDAIPSSVKAIAVLDRTKEPGAPGEPLYLDVVDAFYEYFSNGNTKFAQFPKIVGGRYGLASKEFTPAMVKAVFDNLKLDKPKNHFTIGIIDDVTFTSLEYDPNFSIEPENVVRAMFYGLAADGTVGANKNSVKIIGENTDLYAQGYYVYDSRKAGTLTVSHLRFGPEPIRAPYLISKANFLACHQTVFIEKYHMLHNLVPEGTFLINAPFEGEELWNFFPLSVQKQILDKNLKVYYVDAQKVAEESGMGRRINTIMQVCFFALSGILPREQAIEAIKESIVRTYGKKGDEIVRMNIQAVESTLENLKELYVPQKITATRDVWPPVPDNAPEFVKKVEGEIIAGRGDYLPVSVFPVDGTWPTATTQYEKRNIALEIPVWDEKICIQCGKCAFVCPHATIRIKVFDPKYLENAPSTFKYTDARDKEFAGMKYSIQVAPEDCTGCAVCVEVCPARDKTNPKHKALDMYPQLPLREQEKINWDFFLSLPDIDRRRIKVTNIRQQQIQRPLFEFSGACTGCGETPYVKLLSQLFGDRLLIANATGCSSIYGGNLPTTPFAVDENGRGPTWSNSLFEDNAEFGFGFRLAIDKQKEIAVNLLKGLASQVGEVLVEEIINARQKTEPEIYEQRERVAALIEKLKEIDTPEAKKLSTIADYLVKKSVWVVGGDGWAYDIGYGGLDHVVAMGKDVNLLVLDTEVYSNTGGQSSKATPLGAVAKFAANGKPAFKKDLGWMVMSYKNVYVATVAFGAKDEHTLKAFLEAEAYEGPSVIIAYSHCIAHGIDMTQPLKQHKLAVDSGQWILYRYNPELAAEGKNPLIIDSKEPNVDVAQYMDSEIRFRMLAHSNYELANYLKEMERKYVVERYKLYKHLSEMSYDEFSIAGKK